MPCFDPEDVIFITNKWDTIHVDDSESSDENDKTRTWKDLKEAIKDQWPKVKEDNIFRMNLKQVRIFLLVQTLFIKYE